jgi:hypothetical protein
MTGSFVAVSKALLPPHPVLPTFGFEEDEMAEVLPTRVFKLIMFELSVKSLRLSACLRGEWTVGSSFHRRFVMLSS